jgi:predicted nucleic acid-binding protein
VALVVLDASVLIAYLARDDAHHSAAVHALREHADDELRLPASAYAEVLVGPLRSGWLERARAEVAALLLTVDPITERTAEGAAELRARFPALRLPDALVIAHGDVIDAGVVLTTDGKWPRFSGRARVLG